MNGRLLCSQEGPGHGTRTMVRDADRLPSLARVRGVVAEGTEDAARPVQPAWSQRTTQRRSIGRAYVDDPARLDQQSDARRSDSRTARRRAACQDPPGRAEPVLAVRGDAVADGLRLCEARSRPRLLRDHRLAQRRQVAHGPAIHGAARRVVEGSQGRFPFPRHGGTQGSASPATGEGEAGCVADFPRRGTNRRLLARKPSPATGDLSRLPSGGGFLAVCGGRGRPQRPTSSSHRLPMLGAGFALRPF